MCRVKIIAIEYADRVVTFFWEILKESYKADFIVNLRSESA
jgi:hypothetical protein